MRDQCGAVCDAKAVSWLQGLSRLGEQNGSRASSVASLSPAAYVLSTLSSTAAAGLAARTMAALFAVIPLPAH